MTSVADRAHSLAQMHEGDTMLVLPTVWDVWSAKTVVDAGFSALTIGSHPLADSRGQGDHEAMTLEDALDGVRRICAGVDVPVSADMESGYDTPAQELVDRVLEAGAVGINIEDTVHSKGRLRTSQEHADYIAALRAAADAAGVDLVINARTDVLLPANKDAGGVDEAVRRIKACEEAGARSVYPVGIPDAATLKTLVAAVSVPVNVTASPRKGAPSGSMEELRAAGVRRVTYGPLLQQELAADLKALVEPWRSETS